MNYKKFLNMNPEDVLGRLVYVPISSSAVRILRYSVQSDSIKLKVSLRQSTFETYIKPGQIVDFPSEYTVSDLDYNYYDYLADDLREKLMQDNSSSRNFRGKTVRVLLTSGKVITGKLVFDNPYSLYIIKTGDSNEVTEVLRYEVSGIYEIFTCDFAYLDEEPTMDTEYYYGILLDSLNRTSDKVKVSSTLYQYSGAITGSVRTKTKEDKMIDPIIKKDLEKLTIAIPFPGANNDNTSVKVDNIDAQLVISFPKTHTGLEVPDYIYKIEPRYDHTGVSFCVKDGLIKIEVYAGLEALTVVKPNK